MRKVHVRKVAQPDYLKVVILEYHVIIMVGKGVITYPFAPLSQVLLCTLERSHTQSIQR